MLCKEWKTMQGDSAVAAVLNEITKYVQGWVAQFMAIAIPLVIALYVLILILFIVKRNRKRQGRHRKR